MVVYKNFKLLHNACLTYIYFCPPFNTIRKFSKRGRNPLRANTKINDRLVKYLNYSNQEFH